MSIDFDSLLEGVNKKDMRAWEDLYAGYYAVLCSYVNNILRDRDQAQDIVQDVLVAVWKSSKQFGDMKELTSYLYRSCYNNALIYKRNVQIRKGIEQKIILEAEVEFSDEIFAITVRDELLRQLYCYIKELPDGAREIMELSVLGLSGPEIAEKFCNEKEWEYMEMCMSNRVAGVILCSGTVGVELLVRSGNGELVPNRATLPVSLVVRETT